MIIGLTGSYCSGKDTVADYLVEHRGFTHRSLSDELRAELATRNIPPTRENLIEHGTRLRQTEGDNVLAKRALTHVLPDRDYVITSIRHPDEVRELARHPSFVLVNVDAPVNVRFARMRQRNRPGDPDTIERFQEMERRECQTEGSGQQLHACRAMAAHQFMNAGDSREALFTAIDQFLAHIRT